MLTLHHLNQSRSFRVLWLLEELQDLYTVQYTLQIHARNKNHLAPAELSRLHPMGKAPILVDDELPQGEQAIAESAVILEYLLDKYDARSLLRPVGDAKTDAYRRCLFWTHFAEGSFMPPLVMRLILQKAKAKTPFVVRPVARALQQKIDALILGGNIQKSLDLLEDALSKNAWLAGDFSAADIQMHLPATAALRSADANAYPAARAWLDRCQNRQAFVRAVEIAGDPL